MKTYGRIGTYGLRTEPSISGRWLWLRVLVGGVILFFIIRWALITTGNINYIPSLLLVGAVTVPVSFCLFLYSRSPSPTVSWATLGICAIWGGILGTVLAGFLEYSTLQQLGTLPTIAIGVSEEVAKIIAPAYYIFFRQSVRHDMDSIMLGVASGAGFAILESMGYGLTALLLTQGNVTATVQLLLVRALIAPASHIAWTGLLAEALWRVKNSPRSYNVQYLAVAFMSVVLLHGLWDSATTSWGYVILGVISLGWLLLIVRRSERKTAWLTMPEV